MFALSRQDEPARRTKIRCERGNARKADEANLETAADQLLVAQRRHQAAVSGQRRREDQSVEERRLLHRRVRKGEVAAGAIRQKVQPGRLPHVRHAPQHAARQDGRSHDHQRVG